MAVELDVPLAGLKPGSYLGQLNVVDDAGGTFAFPRFAILVREATPSAPTREPATTGAGAGSSGNQ